MSVRTVGLILMSLAAVVGPFGGYLIHMMWLPLSGIFLISYILFWLLIFSAGLDAFVNGGRQWRAIGLGLIAAALVIGSLGIYLRSTQGKPSSPELTPAFDARSQRSSAQEKEQEENKNSAAASIGLSVVMLLVGVVVFMNGVGLRAMRQPGAKRSGKRRRKSPWTIPRDQPNPPPGDSVS
jgi:hypothetical protein